MRRNVHFRLSGLVQKMRDICQLAVSEFSIAQFSKEGEGDKHCIVGGLLLKKSGDCTRNRRIYFISSHFFLWITH